MIMPLLRVRPSRRKRQFDLLSVVCDPVDPQCQCPERLRIGAEHEPLPAITCRAVLVVFQTLVGEVGTDLVVHPLTGVASDDAASREPVLRSTSSAMSSAGTSAWGVSVVAMQEM